MTDFEAGFKAAIDSLKAKLRESKVSKVLNDHFDYEQDVVAYAVCIQHLEEKLENLSKVVNNESI